MVDNQHKQTSEEWDVLRELTPEIKDYRNLTQDEIEQMNNCKDMAVAVGSMCDIMGKLPNVDQRWLNIARTDLQKGFMALVRSIARPETF